MNPLLWSGPEFLKLYVAGLAGALLLSAVLLRGARRSDDRGRVPSPAELEGMTPYDVALLVGGRRTAARAAVAALLVDDAVRLQDGGRLVLHGDPPSEAHPLEVAVCEAARRGDPVADTVRSVGVQARHLEERLVRDGWLFSGAEVLGTRALVAGPLVTIALAGVARSVADLAGDGPSPTLWLLVVITTVAAWGFAKAAGRRRTRQGDLALRQLRSHYAALDDTARYDGDQLGGQDAALAVALFGLTRVRADALTGLILELEPGVLSDPIDNLIPGVR